MIGQIYKSTNLINSKIYIGQTKCIGLLNARIKRHIKSCKSKITKNDYFHRAINKYGINNFKWEIIEEISDIKEKLFIILNNLEIFWIKKLNTQDPKIGYNLTPGVIHLLILMGV